MKKPKNKPDENKGIWASLYEELEELEKQRNHDEPFIPAPSTPPAPLSPEQFAEKLEVVMDRLFGTSTKK